MSNFRKFISMSAVAMLGVTNLLTPLSYASAATKYDSLSEDDLKHSALRFEMPDRDVFLYAMTEANKYFVKYNGNTHTSWEMWTGTFTYDTTWYLETNKFAKTWYTFTWWNTQAWGWGTWYEDGAAVWNWTAVESGLVNIYAQWKANGYRIIYDLNDDDGGTSSWQHTKTPDSLAYDETWTIDNPSRTWYWFSGWTITNMDSEAHIVGWEASNATSVSGVKGTSFKNLRATSGDVNFKAIWTPDPNTKYDVEHYLERLIGWYGDPIETDHLSWTTDDNVTPEVHTYTWFTKDSNTPYSGNINADGSTVFKYHYTRNSYDLTLVAGRGIAQVSGSGTQNTSGGSDDESVTISFKYEEPVTVSFKLKDWYQSGAWTGYSGTAASFTMGALSGTKTASATPIVYQLTVLPRWGAGATASRTYTVEDEDIPLGTPKRDHSTFEWWTGWVNGEWITSPIQGVVVTWWSIGDREYSAVWSCVTWYHIENTGADNESCQPDTNTKYLVNHIQQDLDWNYTIYIDTGYEYGTTNTDTILTGNSYVWFELSGNIDDYKKNINPDGSTVVNIYYNRLEYAWTIESATWVITPSAQGENSGTSPFKYEDTVELSATVEPGYTWSGWTVEDASWNSVTVTDTTPNDPNGATFQMPASAVTITPHVTRDTYTIEYELYSWSEQSHNPTSYNVESNDITLNVPRRDYSVFKWWTGWVIDWAQLSWTTDPVIISKGSVWNRKYYAVWSCEAWYHDEGWTSCVANDYTVHVDLNYPDGTDTPYDVPFTYASGQTINNPSQSWYDFAWWIVTWISGGNATVDGDPIINGSVTSGTEFNNLTTEEGGTVTLTATWTPRNDTKYVVKHYTKDLSGTAYTLVDTIEYSSWNVEVPVVISSITTGAYSWFTVPTLWYLSWSTAGPSGSGYVEITIDKHGTTVINLYYSRNNYNVYLSWDEHVDVLVGSGSYPFGAEVEVSATAKTWYHFVRWEKRWENFAKIWSGS